MTLTIVHATVAFVNAIGVVFYDGGPFGPDPLKIDITYTNHQTSGVQAILRIGAAKGAPVGTSVAAFDAEHLQWTQQISVNGALSTSIQFDTFADWHIDPTWHLAMWAETANLGTGVFDIGTYTNGGGPTAGGTFDSVQVATIAADVGRTFHNTP